MLKTNVRKYDIFKLYYWHGATLVGKYKLPQLKENKFIPKNVISFNERNGVVKIFLLTTICLRIFGGILKKVLRTSAVLPESSQLIIQCFLNCCLDRLSGTAHGTGLCPIIFRKTGLKRFR